MLRISCIQSAQCVKDSLQHGQHSTTHKAMDSKHIPHKSTYGIAGHWYILWHVEDVLKAVELRKKSEK